MIPINVYIKLMYSGDQRKRLFKRFMMAYQKNQKENNMSILENNLEVLKLHIGKLELKKDDVLVIKLGSEYNDPYTHRDVTEISRWFKELIPNNQFLVINAEMELQVLELKDLELKDGKIISKETK